MKHIIKPDYIDTPARMLLNSRVLSDIEDDGTVTLYSLKGLALEGPSPESIRDTTTLTIDTTEAQWGRIVVCSCPVFTVTVVHYNGVWTVSESVLNEPSTNYGRRPTYRDFSGTYMHFDLLPQEVQDGLRRLGNGTTGMFWHNAGIAEVVANLPDYKGWKPIRTENGELVSVMTPSGRPVVNMRMMRKAPRVMRHEWCMNHAVGRDEVSCMAANGSF